MPSQTKVNEGKREDLTKANLKFIPEAVTTGPMTAQVGPWTPGADTIQWKRNILTMTMVRVSQRAATSPSMQVKNHRKMLSHLCW